MVDKTQIARVTADRFIEWSKRLIEQECTPVVVVGCGSGDPLPKISICAAEQLSLAEIAHFLRLAVIGLEAQHIQKN